MIYAVDGDYVISSHEVWLPGSYDSERTAHYAFQFTNLQLEALQERINRRDQRAITLEDLRAERKEGPRP